MADQDQTAGIGHNQIGGIAGEALTQYVERIERLMDERKGIQGDIKDVFAQIKSAGFDVKIVRSVIRRRAMEASDREEQDQLQELYEAVLLREMLS